MGHTPEQRDDYPLCGAPLAKPGRQGNTTCRNWAGHRTDHPGEGHCRDHDNAATRLAELFDDPAQAQETVKSLTEWATDALVSLKLTQTQHQRLNRGVRDPLDQLTDEQRERLREQLNNYPAKEAEQQEETA